METIKKKRDSYHHGNLKQELLAKAIKIIESDGIQALTLGVLAKELGTSRSAIYRHFSSKDELIKKVMFYGFEVFEKRLAPIFMKKNEDVLKRFNLLCKEYIIFAIEQPNLYRLLFGKQFENIREENYDINDEEQASDFYALVNLLLEAQDNNIFKKEDPLIQGQIIHSMLHGLASLYIDGHIHIKDNIDTLNEACYNILISGLIKKE